MGLTYDISKPLLVEVAWEVANKGNHGIILPQWEEYIP
jgi:hypothetical protein